MSVPGSYLIERSGRRKGTFLWSLYAQRLAWGPIALIPLMLFGHSEPGRALTVFLGLMFFMYAVGSIGSPAWLSWMSDVVPSRLNGKYFSRRRQWGILAAAPAAAFVGWFLDHRVGSDCRAILGWCSIIFLCAGVCGLADIHLFQYVPAHDRPPRRSHRLRDTFREPLRDRSFLCASGFIATLTFALTFLGQFATLYLLDQVGARNMTVQMALVVAPMVGQWLVLGAWGRAADRAGKRPLLILAAIGLVPVGIGWCFVTRGNVWLAYLLAGLGAALWTGVEVVNMSLVLERSARRQQGAGGYAAANSVIINVAGCLGGLAAGGIAQLLRDWHWQPFSGCKMLGFYDVLFLAGGGLRLLALVVFLPLLREPSARSVGYVARFMLTSLVESALRVLRLATRTAALRRLPDSDRAQTPTEAQDSEMLLIESPATRQLGQAPDAGRTGHPGAALPVIHRQRVRRNRGNAEQEAGGQGIDERLVEPAHLVELFVSLGRISDLDAGSAQRLFDDPPVLGGHAVGGSVLGRRLQDQSEIDCRMAGHREGQLGLIAVAMPNPHHQQGAGVESHRQG
jgi:MFS family permease